MGGYDARAGGGVKGASTGRRSVTRPARERPGQRGGRDVDCSHPPASARPDAVQPPPTPPPAAVAPAPDPFVRDTAARGTVARDSGAASGYATAALRALVAEAALGNRLPAGLASYRARVESEIAIAGRREEGLEAVFGVEQVASTLRWTRAGYYDQHVVGDRARQTGLNFSVLGLARTGWATPVLYGNRLRLRRDSVGERRGRGPGRGRRRVRAADTLPVVHPLADDRDRYYRYAGGDTVVTVGSGDRRVPIVRVLVEPRPDAPARTGLFRGEIDLDATRRAVVRLRGRYVVTAGARPSLGARVARALLPQGYAYVEYVNAERTDAAGGRYWLPAYQRIEVQGGVAALGDARGVARLVSRFTDVAVNDTALTAAELAANADSILPRARRRLTRAPADSIERYAAWGAPLGDLTGGAHADDFSDLGPAAAAPVGPPRGEFFVPRVADLVHFNRVDGLYVGAGARTRFRDLAPGLTLVATGGWAGAARTARGRVELTQRLGAGARADRTGGLAAAAGWTLALRAGRTLDLTNDFRAPFDSGSSFGALLGADPYDYVDRRFAGVALTRVVAAGGGAAGARGLVVRAEAGVAEDRGDSNNVRRSPVGGFVYRPNRGVDAGRYVRTALTAEWRPDVAAEFVRPGLGARLYAERGDAVGARGVGYTRVEARLTGRRELYAGGGAGALGRSTLTVVARADAGLVAGGGAAGPPPQQLFELGRTQSLFGYGYKTFAGDRAAALRGLVLFTGPYLRAPLRVWRLALPAPAPGLAGGAQLGRAEASGDAARASVARLGFRNDTAAAGGLRVPASRPSDGWRASVTAGATLFGGGVFVGAVRAVDARADRPRGWRAIVAFAQVL